MKNKVEYCVVRSLPFHGSLTSTQPEMAAGLRDGERAGGEEMEEEVEEIREEIGVDRKEEALQLS